MDVLRGTGPGGKRSAAAVAAARARTSAGGALASAANDLKVTLNVSLDDVLDYLDDAVTFSEIVKKVRALVDAAGRAEAAAAT